MTEGYYVMRFEKGRYISRGRYVVDYEIEMIESGGTIGGECKRNF